MNKKKCESTYCNFYKVVSASKKTEIYLSIQKYSETL
jgi:hypothetical protein